MILPKLFSLLLHVRDRARAAGFGGRAKLAWSVVLETLSSALLAPVLGLLQTQFVAGILLGKKVTWETQDRGDAGTSFSEAWRRHWAATLVGVAWAALLWFAAPKLFWWFSPVFIGLVLVVPVSVWSSRVTTGEWAKAHGWFLTPEEVRPPEILRRLEQNLQAAQTRPWATSRDGLAWVLEEPKVCEVHMALLLPPPETPGPLQAHYLEGLRLKAVHIGRDALTSREKRDLLLDADSVMALRAEPLPAARLAG